MTRFVARSLGALVAIMVGIVAVSPRAGAEYPDRVVRIELGFPAGGGADILARWYADKLQQLSGGHFIVENKVRRFRESGTSGDRHSQAGRRHAALRIDGDDGRQHDRVQGYAARCQEGPRPGHWFCRDAICAVCRLQFADQFNCRTDCLHQIEERQGDVRKRHDKRARLDRALPAEGRGNRDLCVATRRPPNAIQDVNGHQIDFAFADVVFAMGQAKQGRIKISGHRIRRALSGLAGRADLERADRRHDRRHRRPLGPVGAGGHAANPLSTSWRNG